MTRRAASWPSLIERVINGHRATATPPASRRFEWTFVVLSFALLSGAYVDAYAHRHLTVESFVTPWHALLYSAIFAITVFLAVNALRNMRRGYALGMSLPDGYGFSFIGCIAFAVGGVLDFFWHLAFGFERSISILLSPTHLILMASAGLIWIGPFRAAWSRPGPQATYRVIASAAFLLSIFTYFSQFNHPFVNPWAAGDGPPRFETDRSAEELGVLGVLLQGGVLTAVILLLLRRFVLPPGSLTLILGLNALMLSPLEGQYGMIAVALAGGLAADLLLLALRPSAQRIAAWRIFGAALPGVLYTIYFAFLLTTTGIWWPVHLWTGSIVVTAMAGWLLSFGFPAPGAQNATP